MTRETKINLWFLIGFLALALPGAAILFVKKLEPGQRMMYEPAFVRKTEAYNNPQAATSGAIRTFPPMTMAWVAGVADRELGRSPFRFAAAGGRVQPVISDGRRFELLGATPAANDQAGPTLTVLFWSDDFVADADVGITGSARFVENGASWPVASARATALDVPADVDEELRREGFTTPPRRASLLRLTLGPPPGHGEAAATAAPRHLELSWLEADDRRARDEVSLEPSLLQGGVALPAASADGKQATRPDAAAAAAR